MFLIRKNLELKKIQFEKLKFQVGPLERSFILKTITSTGRHIF